MPKSNDANLAASVKQGLDVVTETLARFVEAAQVSRVFGEPVQHGDTVILPAAEVLSVLGFGVGAGGGTEGSKPDENGGEAPEAVAATPAAGRGGGGGGGGCSLARPVAVVVADANGVRVEPVVDATKIALAALTAFGFMAATLASFRRPPRRR